jgi:CRISPR type I-A-associated protein Csa5
MLTLRTPGTGFVDLEAKLAFGLARLAVESGRGCTLIPEHGRYRLEVACTPTQLNEALRLQATRHYATEAAFLLPGVQARYRSNLLTMEDGHLRAVYRDADLPTLFSQAHSGERQPWSRHQCGHETVQEAFGGTSGLILATSSHAGMPTRRDSVSGGNLRLCTVCGLLVVIGIRTACLRNYLGSGRQRLTLFTTLIPQERLQPDDLLEILAMQKEIDQATVCDPVPVQAVPLAILTRYPHLAQVLARRSMRFHLALYSSGRTDRLTATALVAATPLARFIDASPFHEATVELLIDRRRPGPAVEPLVELSRALLLEALLVRRRAVGLFARLYVSEEVGGQPRLLYRVTGQYLTEEVCMIPSHIVEHDAIASVADLVRYFVMHRNYGYVDAIRNARRDSHDFERTLTAMLRECRTRRDPQTGRDDCPRAHFVPLPDEGHIRDVMRLAQKHFEEVKLALSLLGLSRREWEDTPAVARAEDEAVAAEASLTEEDEA